MRGEIVEDGCGDWIVVSMSMCRIEVRNYGESISLFGVPCENSLIEMLSTKWLRLRALRRLPRSSASARQSEWSAKVHSKDDIYNLKLKKIWIIKNSALFGRDLIYVFPALRKSFYIMNR